MTASTLRRCSRLVVNNMKEFSTQVPKRLKRCLARLANRSRLQRCYHSATSAARCMLRRAKQSISRISYRNLFSHSQASSVHDSLPSNWWLKGRAGGSLLKRGGLVAPAVVHEGVGPAGLFVVREKKIDLCVCRKSALKRSGVIEESSVTGRGLRNGCKWLLGFNTKPPPRRVRFLGGLVTDVVTIESHRSFTMEERLTTFSGKFEIQAMARRNYIERAWERRLGRVVEEDEFFVDSCGGRWHPAHWMLLRQDHLATSS